MAFAGAARADDRRHAAGPFGPALDQRKGRFVGGAREEVVAAKTLGVRKIERKLTGEDAGPRHGHWPPPRGLSV